MVKERFHPSRWNAFVDRIDGHVMVIFPNAGFISIDLLRHVEIKLIKVYKMRSGASLLALEDLLPPERRVIALKYSLLKNWRLGFPSILKILIFKIRSFVLALVQNLEA